MRLHELCWYFCMQVQIYGNNNEQMNLRGLHHNNGAGSAAPQPGPVAPQLGSAAPMPTAAGHSRPHLARARPGRTNMCARAYHMPCLGSTAPTIPRTSLAPCSLGLSATSQQYFSLRTNQPPATSKNQPAVLFSQNKPAPAISHQPTEQAVGWMRNVDSMSVGSKG
jgi:hypothetical protein